MLFRPLEEDFGFEFGCSSFGLGPLDKRSAVSLLPVLLEAVLALSSRLLEFDLSVEFLRSLLLDFDKVSWVVFSNLPLSFVRSDPEELGLSAWEGGLEVARPLCDEVLRALPLDDFELVPLLEDASCLLELDFDLPFSEEFLLSLLLDFEVSLIAFSDPTLSFVSFDPEERIFSAEEDWWEVTGPF